MQMCEKPILVWKLQYKYYERSYLCTGGRILKKFNFSCRHWLIIMFCFLMFLFYNASTSDGMNVIIPQLSEDNGWNYEYILSFASLAGCAGVAGQLFLGRVCEKCGTRFLIIFSLVGAAIFFLFYGNSVSIPMYVVSLCGLQICSAGYAYIGGSAIIVSWFPGKKGIASGIAAMGAPVSSTISVALLTMMFRMVGLGKSMVIGGLILFGMAVLGLFIVYDTPEQKGEYPDNIKPEDMRQNDILLKDIEEDGMPLKQMIHQKKMWITGIIFGLNSMATLGIMGQFVVRHKEAGIPENTVLVMLSICALAGIAGGPFMGMLEQRFGVRKAFSLSCIIYVVGFLMNFSNMRIGIGISIILFGIGVTGTQIFLPSFLVNIFGRKDFKSAYAIAFPLSNLMCQLCFLVNAAALRWFGEIRFAYLFFAGGMTTALILVQTLKMHNPYSK